MQEGIQVTLQLTNTVDILRYNTNLNPQIVFSIDGVSTKFGAVQIYEYVRIGDPGLYIDNINGDPWTIGGLKLLDDQSDYISIGSGGGGTTTRITQQLSPDKGIGTSVSNLAVALIDKNEEISELISPGFVLSEILGRRAKVEIGFQNTAYPEDYVTIFRGVIEDIQSGPGLITFALSSTEQKKRQTLFARATTTLAGSISDVGSISTISLDDSTGFFQPITGPNGLQDSEIEFFVRIGDEFFKYTGISGNTLTGVTRNASPLNYGQSAHAIGDDVSSVIRLNGSGLNIARKLMFSMNGYFLTGIPFKNFVQIAPANNVANSIFFYEKDMENEHGIYIGDYITTTGASNGANNVTLKQITDVVKTNDGTYIVVDGVSFVQEINTSATISFRSQFDTFPDGCKMKADDVDLREIDKFYRLFLSGFNYDFRLTDSIEAKTFIEDQILRPMTAFSIPRKGRISVGYHVGPLPGASIIELNQTNILEPNKLKIRRSLSKNYYNTVIYYLDLDTRDNKYLTTSTNYDSSSINDFGVGQRSISISSQGLRTDNGGQQLSQLASERFLNRYKRGAEYLDGVNVHFGDSFNIEIGDLILLNTQSLQITNIKSGTRSGDTRIFQVLNKTMDIKSGDVSFTLVDTKYNNAARYSLTGPASLVRTGISGTQFIIKSSYSSVYGTNEYLKWQRYGQVYVRVRSPNGITRNAISQIDSFSGNTLTLQTTLGFTPQTDDIMEFAHYDDMDTTVTERYAFMRNTDPFSDGQNRYVML